MARHLYQEHFIALARLRLGRERADRLLRDAEGRSTMLQRDLGDALAMEMRSRRVDGRRVLTGIDRELPGWVGAELQTDTTLPDTIQALLAGRRLGDVVAGSGADDAVITMSADRSLGTRIWLDERLLRADRLSPWSEGTGWLRRGWRIATLHFHEMHVDRRHVRTPTLGDLGMHAAMMGGSLLFAATIIMLLATGRIPAAMFAVFAPGGAWLVGGTTCTLVIDIKRYVKQKRTNA